MKKFWKNTPSEYKDYLFIYLWGVIWGALCLVQPRLVGGPGVYDWATAAGRFWSFITIVGGVLAIVGLIRKDNLILERLGVTLLMVGPVSYSLTLFGELVFRSVSVDLNDTTSSWRILTVMVFALWPFLFLNKRRRQLRNRVKLVSEIPLPEESSEK